MRAVAATAAAAAAVAWAAVAAAWAAVAWAWALRVVHADGGRKVESFAFSRELSPGCQSYLSLSIYR